MRRNAHNPKQHATRGYTLMELMVVLALIAIAAALVAPAVGHAFSSFQLRMGATSLATICKQARTHSVYEGRGYMIMFGAADESPRMLYLVRDDGKTIQHAALPAQVRLRAEQHGNWSSDLQPVHFFPNGSSEGAQIDMESDRGRHVQIVLEPLTARARVSQIYADTEAAAPGVVHVVSGGGQ